MHISNRHVAETIRYTKGNLQLPLDPRQGDRIGAVVNYYFENRKNADIAGQNCYLSGRPFYDGLDAQAKTLLNHIAKLVHILTTRKQLLPYGTGGQLTGDYTAEIDEQITRLNHELAELINDLPSILTATAFDNPNDNFKQTILVYLADNNLADASVIACAHTFIAGKLTELASNITLDTYAVQLDEFNVLLTLLEPLQRYIQPEHVEAMQTKHTALLTAYGEAPTFLARTWAGIKDSFMYAGRGYGSDWKFHTVIVGFATALYTGSYIFFKSYTANLAEGLAVMQRLQQKAESGNTDAQKALEILARRDENLGMNQPTQAMVDFNNNLLTWYPWVAGIATVGVLGVLAGENLISAIRYGLNPPPDLPDWCTVAPQQTTTTTTTTVVLAADSPVGSGGTTTTTADAEAARNELHHRTPTHGAGVGAS